MLTPRRLPNTDLMLSDVGLGTADVATTDRDLFADLMRVYRDSGGNFVDTAHVYSCWKPAGAGTSECAIGDYLKANPNSGLIVSTKGGHPSMPAYRVVDRYLSAERVGCDIEDSLGRLRVEAIDLFWLHRDDPRESVETVIDYLNDQIQRGRVRYVGASNWTPARIEAANAYAASKGLQGFVAQQPQWSLAECNGHSDPTVLLVRTPERNWHERHRFPMFPWNSTARGYFATNGQRGRESFDNPTSRSRLRAVQHLAAELGRSPAQIAMRYLVDQPFPCFPLLGTKNVEHLRDILGLGDFRLTDEQLKQLEAGLPT